MGKIFYIMGKSASGKDTIYERVLHREGLHLQRLVPYTTRPIRSNEMEGVEYHFVGEEKLQEFLRDGKVIELREYHTMHGIWKYFTVDDEYMDLENKDYLAIGTLESYEKIRNYYGEEKIVPLYIEVEEIYIGTPSEEEETIIRELERRLNAHIGNEEIHRAIVYSATEPTGRRDGDQWLKEYS